MSKTLGDQPQITNLEYGVNLGCGEDYRPGMVNIDINDRYKADKYADLNDDWPIPSESTNLVLASHILEHLQDPQHFFDEAARILKDGGTLKVNLPLGINAFTDITHETVWTYDTLLQFDQSWREKDGSYQFDPTVPFELQRRKIDLHIHGPFKFMSPLFRHLAKRNPGVWTSGVPMGSGELTGLYKRLER